MIMQTEAEKTGTTVEREDVSLGSRRLKGEAGNAPKEKMLRLRPRKHDEKDQEEKEENDSQHV